MQGPIVVGTDGSATATAAVLEALELAKRFEVPLHVVCAYKAQSLKAGGIPSEYAASLGSASQVDALLDDIGSRARQAGAQVETHAIVGDAAESILELAESIGAGLIVIGNRGIASVKRFMLGNVPSKVVHNAPCSTYVVHTT
jgi:nucleotide-binding universal stress UspA family protein